MRILRLEAENVKRLGVVEITPDGNLVEIAGKNAQGKTSVLDAIWWALAGVDAIQKEPIKRGKSEARIILDLGDDKGGMKLRVIRKFKKIDGADTTTSLRVEDDGGAPVRAPQSILDALVGAISFDPLEFGRSKPGERVAILKSMVPDFDFDAAAVKRTRAFDKRTESNREAKRLRAAAVSIDVPTGLPDKPIDVKDIAAKIDAATNAQREADRIEARKVLLFREAAALTAEVNAARAEMDRLMAIAETKAAEALARAQEAEAIVVPAVPVVSDLRAELDRSQDVNAAIAERDRKAALTADADTAEAESEKLTNALDEIDNAVTAAVANAELPVRGLTLGAEDVMLHGVPFEQASDAEQLRASIAIAMAANPDLRVIRVRDGSLLDSDGFAVLAAVATQEDYQIWVESVSPHSASAVIMEDGHVQ